METLMEAALEADGTAAGPERTELSSSCLSSRSARKFCNPGRARLPREVAEVSAAKVAQPGSPVEILMEADGTVLGAE